MRTVELETSRENWDIGPPAPGHSPRQPRQLQIEEPEPEALVAAAAPAPRALPRHAAPPPPASPAALRSPARVAQAYVNAVNGAAASASASPSGKGRKLFAPADAATSPGYVPGFALTPPASPSSRSKRVQHAAQLAVLPSAFEEARVELKGVLATPLGSPAPRPSAPAALVDPASGLRFRCLKKCRLTVRAAQGA